MGRSWGTYSTSVMWLTRGAGYRKKSTEGYVFAIQEQLCGTARGS